MSHQPGRMCLGYFPTRDIGPREVTSWPPPVEPNGPWTRCPECAAAEREDAAERAAARTDGELDAARREWFP